jgi:hypothetical protein
MAKYTYVKFEHRILIWTSRCILWFHLIGSRLHFLIKRVGNVTIISKASINAAEVDTQMQDESKP